MVNKLRNTEYFKAIKPEKIDAQIINIVFKENKNGTYRVVSFYAKKARGMMSRFIIKNRITNIEDIKIFNEEGYRFMPEESSKEKYVFVR